MTQQPDPLMPFLLAVLTPFLMAAGIPDPDLARQAATETIQSYKATTKDQLVTTAQIIAFAFASLENLRLSAPEDLSLSMKLKLRANANALNAASQKAAATLQTQRQTPAPTPTLETTIQQAQPDNQTDLAWAAAMTDVATEYTTELPNLPAAQQRAHQARINALSKIAQSLGNGTAPPLKDRLLASTALKL